MFYTPGLCNEQTGQQVDGDELNGCLVLDDFTLQRLKRLSPYLGVMDLNRVGKVSKDLKMPAPMVSMLSRWANQSNHVVRQY